METHVILRRSGWRTGADLEAAADRSIIEGEQTPDDIRWIRSYVLDETDGKLDLCRRCRAELAHLFSANSRGFQLSASCRWCEPLPAPTAAGGGAPVALTSS